MKKINVLLILAVSLLASCGDDSITQVESSLSTSINNSEESSLSEESSTSSEGVNGMVSREVWENQINELGCLEGNYEITTEMTVNDWKYLAVFQHTNDSYHYTEEAIEYVGQYALPPGANTEYFYEEYLFVKDSKYLMYAREDKRYGFIKSYADDEYDSFDKTTLCSIPGVFFRQLNYDDVDWNDDHYEATEMHESIDYGTWVYEYDSTEIKLKFDESDRVSEFEYNTTTKGYEKGVLKETSNFLFNGSFTGYDNVVITEPQNILLDRT